MTTIPLGDAWRMLRRDWRGGELRWLALAVVLAVAAVTSVACLTDRLRQNLQLRAAQYLGGDAAIATDRVPDPAWDARAQAIGLHTARATSFPSMASALPAQGGASALVHLKAVTASYPLRGDLMLDAGAGPVAWHGALPRGSAWVERSVLPALGLHLGDRVVVGRSTLRLAGIVVEEPDRAAQMLGFAPRLLMNADDLDATDLIQPGSRVSYRWTAAGDAAAVHRLAGQLEGQLGRGQHLETAVDGRPELQTTLVRADRYLGLVALVTVLVAALAVASAARRLVGRRLDACAVMRCLGVTQARLLGLFVVEWTLLAIAASVVGVVGGYLAHLALLGALGTVLPAGLPPVGWGPIAQGLGCGLLLVMAFGVPPLAQLRHVPPLRVLRRDLGPPAPSALLVAAAAAGGFLVFILWMAGDVRLALVAGGGFLGAVALIGLLAHLALGALRHLPGRHRLPWSWRLALAGLRRRRAANVAQVLALALGIMALLVLAMVRHDLLAQWQAQAPPDAPNHFFINIEPDQVDGLAARLRAAGVAAEFEPMVRGRLVAIDGRAVGPEDYPDERARALIDREFNLSYGDRAPAHNDLVEGRWFAPQAQELSIEQGIARRLGIRLGQVLRFDVGGETVEARVSSVRRVRWESMRVNFFVIMPPRLLRDEPQTWITAVRLDAGQDALVNALVREFPNVSVIDTAQVFAQLKALIDQLAAAVQFLFVFALAAGVLVLFTALATSQDERSREAALLRALGAERQVLAAALRAEMLLIGALAGVLGAAAALALVAAIAQGALEFDFHPSAPTALGGVVLGIAAALAASWSGLRRIVSTAPATVLREVT